MVQERKKSIRQMEASGGGDKKINNKIDLSNEDHCGPCGQYILDKRKSKITADLSEPIDKI